MAEGKSPLLANIESVEDIIIKAHQIMSFLNEPRSVVIEIGNGTDQPLNLVSHYHDHGGFAVTPNQVIPPGKVGIFGSQSKGGSVFTGTQGNIVYSADGFITTVFWDNPYFGSNSAHIDIKGPKFRAFKISAIAGAGNQKAETKFEVLPYPIQAVDLSDGSMMREISRPEIFVTFGGAKFWVPSSQWVERYGGWGALKVVSDGALANTPTVPRDGTVLKEWSNNRVYLMKNGSKAWISSPDRFTQLGLDWNALRTVPDGGLAAIPDGPDA